MIDMIDILLFQKDRAKHLFGVFEKVVVSEDDPVIKFAIEELKDNQYHYFPFFKLSEDFDIVIKEGHEELGRINIKGFKHKLPFQADERKS